MVLANSLFVESVLVINLDICDGGARRLTVYTGIGHDSPHVLVRWRNVRCVIELFPVSLTETFIIMVGIVALCTGCLLTQYFDSSEIG